MHASLSSNHACFMRQLNQKRHHTNVVGCEVKTLHSELLPSSNAVMKILGANAGGYIVRFFFLSFPKCGMAPLVGDMDTHTLVWPL